MHKAFFETKCLHVAYGKIHALHGINLRIEEGEIVALIGSNGAGKSTFLKTVSGLLRPKTGGIHFQGHRLDGMPPHDITRRGVVQIPEGRRIFPLLSVEENLMMGGFFRKDRQCLEKDKADIYDAFPILKDRKSQLGGTLSGGEQQILALARALMSRPRLLMLDEPSMGLAPLYVARIFEKIREINRQGVTILLVEQNAQAALAIARRGYVLETGSVAMEGCTADLLKNERVKQCYLGIEEKFLD